MSFGVSFATGGVPPMWTGSRRERTRPICQSSNPRKSSWSSTSRPPGRLASTFLRCARARRRGDRITEINPLGMSLPGASLRLDSSQVISAYGPRRKLASRFWHRSMSSQLAFASGPQLSSQPEGRAPGAAILSPHVFLLLPSSF